MSVFTGVQRRLVIDLFLERITFEQFRAQARIDPREPGYLERALEAAIAGGVHEDLEAVFLLGSATGSRVAMSASLLSSVLSSLLSARWHRSHEDFARELQRLRDPSTVEALAASALLRFEYLAHDESHAFARKCCWALADIGTREARERLRVLARNQDAEIRRYAQKRLDGWADEMSRKGPGADPP